MSPEDREKIESLIDRKTNLLLEDIKNKLEEKVGEDRVENIAVKQINSRGIGFLLLSFLASGFVAWFVPQMVLSRAEGTVEAAANVANLASAINRDREELDDFISEKTNQLSVSTSFRGLPFAIICPLIVNRKQRLVTLYLHESPTEISILPVDYRSISTSPAVIRLSSDLSIESVFALQEPEEEVEVTGMNYCKEGSTIRDVIDAGRAYGLVPITGQLSDQ